MGLTIHYRGAAETEPGALGTGIGGALAGGRLRDRSYFALKVNTVLSFIGVPGRTTIDGKFP